MNEYLSEDLSDINCAGNCSNASPDAILTSRSIKKQAYSRDLSDKIVFRRKLEALQNGWMAEARILKHNLSPTTLIIRNILMTPNLKNNDVLF